MSVTSKLTGQERRTLSADAATAAEGGRPEVLKVLGSARTVRLARGTISVGTAPECDLVLMDPYVSRVHCTLAVERDGVWIRDEASRNGTWVENMRVDRSRVRCGTRIVVGQSCLQLQGRGYDVAPFGIVGQHPSMQRVLQLIQRYGPSRLPVLIQGETGTGKELVARALHECSACRGERFEPINCAAIPRELAEAQLFGHARGAFTGATRERMGAFERASGGTLFLDEVGEMPLELQPKLLRVLEEGEVRRIGDDEHRRVDVRVVAATHRDLERDAGAGGFRLDLFHRLAVGVIDVPPLRKRREDIPLLVEHFMRRGAGVVGAGSITDQALEYLKGRHWSGNVRQLRHALDRAAAEAGARIDVTDLKRLRVGGAPTIEQRDRILYLGRPFAETKREIFIRTLERHHGNRAAAAVELGIPKSTFFDQLRRMQLEE